LLLIPAHAPGHADVDVCYVTLEIAVQSIAQTAWLRHNKWPSQVRLTSGAWSAETAKYWYTVCRARRKPVTWWRKWRPETCMQKPDVRVDGAY